MKRLIHTIEIILFKILVSIDLWVNMNKKKRIIYKIFRKYELFTENTVFLSDFEVKLSVFEYEYLLDLYQRSMKEMRQILEDKRLDLNIIDKSVRKFN